ncbi:globin domain-containing protein [Streptomyces sp. NPDC090303]|uniref:globin domain-containing protein n=1 Tax=Streptomyces sp. NPDC090303 TaxID=3365960 RepID=UPI003819A0AA
MRRTLREIAPVADRVTSHFYSLLFIRHPHVRSLFPPAMDVQRDRLLKALLTAAELMVSPTRLTGYLQDLGRGHRKYGTEPEHYPAVGQALIGALSAHAPRTWDEATESAWTRTYQTIARIMTDAAAADARAAPPWWSAEIVSHRMRSPRVAEIAVRTDRPYPYVPGQFASVETPWWPRVWRNYSFARAPREDGLLVFLVKALPAGWVSNALVNHARPGDFLRLGRSEGSMVVDHTTDRGLLCLGGGTGIAPVRAIVEDVVERDGDRPVDVFYGAEDGNGLCEIDALLRLKQKYPRLTVRAVVGEAPRVIDSVREFGPWHGYDAYVSGPVGMVRQGVRGLENLGFLPQSILHDPLETLLSAVECR